MNRIGKWICFRACLCKREIGGCKDIAIFSGKVNLEVGNFDLIGRKILPEFLHLCIYAYDIQLYCTVV